MKVVGSVEVRNRTLCYSNCPKSRAQRSVLVLGKGAGGRSDMYILHQTNQNRVGTRYKVSGNILKVFMRFIQSGKVTISFREPPNDLFINCVPRELCEFMGMLKLCLDHSVPIQTLKFSVPVAKIPAKPKTEMKVDKDSNHPSVVSFPSSLESLKMSSVGMRMFDPRILCLQHLKQVDVSMNNLKKLPVEIGMLKNLHTLILSRNELGKGCITDWQWLYADGLSQSLKKLELSGNEMTYIPCQITRLRGLCYLGLARNNLTRLPHGLGKLGSLRMLDISSNYLEFLPASARMLKLEDIDVSYNPFQSFQEFQACILRCQAPLTVPSLKEAAARIIVNTNVPYDLEGIPSTLVNYLDSAMYCVCGSACFESFKKVAGVLDLHSISVSITRMVGHCHIVPVESVVCSVKCFNTVL